MATMQTAGPSFSRRHRDEQRFRLLVTVTFPVFLAIALMRAPFAAVGLCPDDGGPRSPFRRARAMAYQVLPFAFMG